MDEGRVLSFRRDPATGWLEPLNSQPSGGALPCHLALSADGGHLLAANYGSGGFAVFPLGPDGRIGPPCDLARPEGSGPDAARQAGPHAHFIAEDPTLGLVLGADLGTDRVHLWHLDRAEGRLHPAPAPAIHTAGGTGRATWPSAPKRAASSS